MMHRHGIGLVLLVIALGGCSAGASTPTHAPQVTEVATPAPPTRTPSPIATSQPTALVAPTLQSKSGLMMAVRKHIQDAPALDIPKNVLNADYSFGSQFDDASRPYTQSWLTTWLRAYQDPGGDPALALSGVQTVQTEFVYCPQFPCDSLIIIGTFDAKPGDPEHSLWTQTFSEINPGGWVRLDGFIFMFQQDRDVFKLTDIYLNRPSGFAYLFNADQFSGMTDVQIISELMNRWFGIFVSSDVCPDARLQDFSIDAIQPEIDVDNTATFTVTFSTKWPADLPPVNCQWLWGGRFAGTMDQDTGWIHKRLYFVGLRHQDNQIIFRSMLNYRPEFDRLVLSSQLGVDTPQALAGAVMERFMKTYRIGPYITGYSIKMLDYKVETASKLDLNQPKDFNGEYFGLEVRYSAIPYQYLTFDGGCPAISCDGEWDRSSPWVTNIYECFIMERIEGGYKIYNFNEEGCWPPPWVNN